MAICPVDNLLISLFITFDRRILGVVEGIMALVAGVTIRLEGHEKELATLAMTGMILMDMA